MGAKSGTAELGNGKNHVYLVAITEKYTLVLSYNETENSSGCLIGPMQGLLTEVASL